MNQKPDRYTTENIFIEEYDHIPYINVVFPDKTVSYSVIRGRLNSRTDYITTFFGEIDTVLVPLD